MNALQMLDEGIAKGDMELIKKAKQLLDNPTPIPPKGGSGVVKAKKKKKKVSVKVKTVVKVKKDKTPKFKTDAEYFEYLAKLEEEHRNNVINGKAGALGSNSVDVADFTKACQEDSKLDEKMGKKKRSKPQSRSTIKFVKKICPRCGGRVEIVSTDVNTYNWNIGDVNSEKPLFHCGKC